MKRSFIFALILVLAAACKTQEDIRREKTVEVLNEQVVQTQKNTANANARFTAIEEQVMRLQGMLEETQHNKQQVIKDAALLKERLNNLEETNKLQSQYIKEINDKLTEQSNYIEQVLKTLSTLSEKESTPKKKEIKNEKPDGVEGVTVADGIAQFKDKNFDIAKSIFLDAIKAKKTKNKDKEAASFYLGQIEYKNKNYEEANVYFSKLFSDNPESSYAAGALLGLARSFIQLKAKDEAAQSLDELISRFPKSKEAQEGAKLKAKL